jgi:HEAT repeat protein
VHEEAFHIIEESMKSSYEQIQLIALQALANCQADRADYFLNKAMGSPSLLVRLVAAHQLCKKKHPRAVSQTESLMFKTPKEMWSIYPQLYAIVGDEQAMRMLRKLLNHSSEKVRTAVILSAAQHGHDDLLPHIRQQITHFNFAQQEASAFAVGLLKDDQSIEKLEKIIQSQYPTVQLAAYYALYQLGKRTTAAKAIAKLAKEADLFAIQTLGHIPEEVETVANLLHHTNPHVQLNAALALLELGDRRCLPYLKAILLHNKQDIGFFTVSSPGKAFKAWKMMPSASQVFKEDIGAYMEHIELRENVLSRLREFAEVDFLQFAQEILMTSQNDLISPLMQLLEEMATPAVIQLLQQFQQQPGTPLVRQYCNLALYRLKEPGPYRENLCDWVKGQNKEDLIRFQPFDPWKMLKKYQFTPEQTSHLLIEAFEAFANHQDNEGIDALLDAIAKGNTKNKYALAGLLLRATQ